MDGYAYSAKTVLFVLFILYLSIEPAHTIVGTWEPSIPSTWAKLQISPKPIASMPYSNFRVNIYEHFDNRKTSTVPNRKRYFYSPIALLDHQSISSSINNVTLQPELIFRVHLWNEHVENETTTYLTKLLGNKVERHQVQVLSFDKVVLTSSLPSTLYKIPTNWMPCQQSKSVGFTLRCFSASHCRQLAQNVQRNPERFEHFRLLFSLDSMKFQTKEIAIQLDVVFSDELANTILRRFPKMKEVLVALKEENMLLEKMTSKVLREYFEQSDVISRDSESQVYRILQRLLISTSQTIDPASDNDLWKSVFWLDEDYRPDKLCQVLNNIYTNLDNIRKGDFLDSIVTRNASDNSKSNTLKLVMDNFRSKSLNVTEDLKEFNEKFDVEDNEFITWNGTKFVPKPIQLSTINLELLRGANKSANVQMRYSTALLTSPLRTTSLFYSFPERHDIQPNNIIIDNEIAKDRVYKLPVSCWELLESGHRLAGIYLVKASYGIEAVHCRFTEKPGRKSYQRNIGRVDVRSQRTLDHFYVGKSKNSYFNQTHVPIPFDWPENNNSTAMDLSTGFYVAKSSGMYRFHLIGTVVQTQPEKHKGEIGISIMHNHYTIGGSWVYFHNDTFQTAKEFTIQALDLVKRGDYIWCNIWTQTNAAVWTATLTGWLIEENF